MTAPASSNPSRTPFGKHLIRAATRAGSLVNQVETKVLHSQFWARVPFGYRLVSMQVLKLILLLAVASVAFLLAIGMVALWTIAALPISTVRQPQMHEMSHPRHHLRYPEMYDDNGAPR